MNLFDLPPELILNIINFIDYKTISTLTKTNSYFREIIKHNIDSIISRLYNSKDSTAYYWINYFDYGKGFDIFIKISKILTRLYNEDHILYGIHNIYIFNNDVIKFILLGCKYNSAYGISKNFSDSKKKMMKKLLKEGFDSDYCYQKIGKYYFTENMICNMILLKKAKCPDDYCHIISNNDNKVQTLIKLLNDNFSINIAFDAVQQLSVNQIILMKKLYKIQYSERYCFDAAYYLNSIQIDKIIYLKNTYPGFSDRFYYQLAEYNVNDIYINYAVKLKNIGYYKLDNILSEIDCIDIITKLTPIQIDNIILLKENDFDNMYSKQGGIELTSDQITIAIELKEYDFNEFQCIKGAKLNEIQLNIMKKLKKDKLNLINYAEVALYTQEQINTIYYLHDNNFTDEYSEYAGYYEFTKEQIDIMISIKNKGYSENISFLCARLNNDIKITKFLELIASNISSNTHSQKCYSVVSKN